MNKPILNFCCCCCDLKIGSCIYVAFTLVSSVFFAIFAIASSSTKRLENDEVLKEKGPDVQEVADIPSCKFKIF